MVEVFEFFVVSRRCLRTGHLLAEQALIDYFETYHGAMMPRPRERVCLQDGLKLDLNGLAQNGFIRRGANIGSRGIRWTHSYWGEIATGTVSADMRGRDGSWFRIQLGSLDRWITLISRPRHFIGPLFAISDQLVKEAGHGAAA